MKNLILGLFILGFLAPATAQYRQQQIQYAGYNILLGGVTSGVGAAINTPKGGKWLRNAKNGFLKGAIGGAVIYAGKKSLVLIPQEEKLGYAWISRIIHNTGASMMENASYNRGLMSVLSYDLYFTRYSIDTRTLKHSLRIQPIALLNVIWSVPQGRFNLLQTLESGQVVFHGYSSEKSKNNGKNYINATIWSNTTSWLKYNTFAHELTHSFQEREYLVFNTYYNPIKGKRIEKYIFLDYRIKPLIGACLDQCSGEHHHNKFFEGEAYHFGYQREIHHNNSYPFNF